MEALRLLLAAAFKLVENLEEKRYKFDNNYETTSVQFFPDDQDDPKFQLDRISYIMMEKYLHLL